MQNNIINTEKSRFYSIRGCISIKGRNDANNFRDETNERKRKKKNLLLCVGSEHVTRTFNDTTYIA